MPVKTVCLSRNPRKYMSSNTSSSCDFRTKSVAVTWRNTRNSSLCCRTISAIYALVPTFCGNRPGLPSRANTCPVICWYVTEVNPRTSRPCAPSHCGGYWGWVLLPFPWTSLIFKIWEAWFSGNDREKEICFDCFWVYHFEVVLYSLCSVVVFLSPMINH